MRRLFYEELADANSFDAMGNKIDAPKQVKKLTAKEERAAKKKRMVRLALASLPDTLQMRKKAGLGSDDEDDA